MCSRTPRTSPRGRLRAPSTPPRSRTWKGGKLILLKGSRTPARGPPGAVGAVALVVVARVRRVGARGALDGRARALGAVVARRARGRHRRPAAAAVVRRVAGVALVGRAQIRRRGVRPREARVLVGHGRARRPRRAVVARTAVRDRVRRRRAVADVARQALVALALVRQIPRVGERSRVAGPLGHARRARRADVARGAAHGVEHAVHAHVFAGPAREALAAVVEVRRAFERVVRACVAGVWSNVAGPERRGLSSPAGHATGSATPCSQ